jgi:hypothetical protein
MTAGNTEVHSIFADDTTYEMLCEGESFALGESNGQDFIYLDDQSNLVIEPSADLVSNVGTYDVEVLHMHAGEEPVSEWVIVTVEANCEAQSWEALEGLPSSIEMSYVGSVFDSNEMLELITDVEGNSWTDLCGTAQLSLLEPMDGVTIDNNEVYV